MFVDARIRDSFWVRLLVRTAAALLFPAVLVLPAAGADAASAAYWGNPAGEAAASQVVQMERFDVQKGQVVGSVPVTEAIRQELLTLAQSASGSAGTFRIDPTDGTVLHFPLQPGLEIRQPGFYAWAAEGYLFLPKSREPYILFFSEENEPRLFGLKHSVNRLLALCGWEDAYAPAGQ